MADAYTDGYEPEDDEPCLSADRPEAPRTALYGGGWNRSAGPAGRRRRKRCLARARRDAAAVNDRIGRIFA